MKYLKYNFTPPWQLAEMKITNLIIICKNISKFKSLLQTIMFKIFDRLLLMTIDSNQTKFQYLGFFFNMQDGRKQKKTSIS
jgi:hypothetical protein